MYKIELKLTIVSYRKKCMYISYRKKCMYIYVHDRIYCKVHFIIVNNARYVWITYTTWIDICELIW